MSNPIDRNTRLILFDHDDTLVGTIKPKWRQHKYVARIHYNKELMDEEIREHWGKPLPELVRLLYNSQDADQALERYLSYNERFPKEAFASTLPVLQYLSSKGFLVGVVTATIRSSFEHDLHTQGLKGLFDYTQTVEDSAYHKPDWRVFEPTMIWLKTKNIIPREVLYVGDGLHDMKAAMEAGFAFIGVETGLFGAADFKRVRAASVPELSALMRRKSHV